jgi:nucleotide-binding universal stress UspA family protein
MTCKTILVHAEPGPGSDTRVRLAVEAAALFGARVIGVGAQAFHPVFASGYAGADTAVIEGMRARIIADMPVAEQRFHELTAKVAAGVSWVSGMDEPARALATHARGADLIVSSRSRAGADQSPALSDLVMEAGGPVLVAADSGRPLNAERILVAWKDGREARRALSDAMPWLEQAKAVVVVAVGGDASDGVDNAGLAEIVERLARRGVAATAETTTRRRATIAEELEQAASRHGAEMIVAGAYGHARLREWMLGGVTEDLLAASSKCVLFSH